MKKNIIMFTCVISSLLFLFCFRMSDYKIYFQTSQFHSYIVDRNQTKTHLVNVTDKQNQDYILSSVLEVAKEEKKPVVFLGHNQNNEEIDVMQLFVYSPYEFDTPLYFTKSKQNIDFSKDDSKKYYTSFLEDKNSYNFLTSFTHSYFSDAEIQINIYPFSQSIGKNFMDEGLTFFIYTNQFESFKQNVELRLEKLDKNIEFNDETEGYHQADDTIDVHLQQDKYIYALLVAFVAYIIGYCILVSKDSKKIGIYRMHGYSPFKIVFKYYFVFMAKMIFCFILPILLGILLFTNIHDQMYYELYNMLKGYLVIYISFIPVLYITLVIYIYITSRVFDIKQSCHLKKILQINYFFKICIALLLLVPFCETIDNSVPIITDYFSIIKYKDIINNCQRVRSDVILEDNQILNEFLNIGYYSDYISYNVYSDLNNPLLYDNRDELIEDSYMAHPYIVANEQYLRVFQNNIIDVNGEPIKLNQLKSHTLLVPQKYMGENLTPYLHGVQKDSQVVYVKNTGSYTNFEVKNALHRVDNPIICYVSTWKTYDMSSSLLLMPRNSQYTSQYYEDILNKYQIEPEVISFILTKSSMDYYLQQLETAITDMVGLICLYTFVFGLFLYQSTYIYLLKNKKKMAIQYLNGLSRFYRYQDIIIQNICVYLIVIISSLIIFKNSLFYTMQFTIFFIIIEVIIQVILLSLNERKNIALAMKGG